MEITMTDELRKNGRKVPGYNEDFYPDNRITHARRSSYGSSTRVYGRGAAFAEKGNGKGKENNSEKVARRGKAKVGEARREAGQRKRFIERRRGLLLAVACILIFAAVLGLIYKLVFVVKSINISGSDTYSNEEIIDGAGITEGMNLYSFRASTVARRITLNCPYIREVVLDREIPNTVNIKATEDKAAYYTVVYGEYKLLSEGLRVLETVSADKLPEGLPKLKLPTVSYAVAGRKIEFALEKRETEIFDILKAVGDSELAERLTVIDLRDRYDITFVCDAKYKLIIGENDDVDYKLRVASKVLLDEMFSTDNKFRIDLTVRGKTGVVMDNNMDLE